MHDAGRRDAPSPVDQANFDAAQDSQPVRCVEGWPAPKHTSPQPSLQDVGSPRVLWEKTVPWRGLRAGIVLSAGHLAFTGGNKLWIMDLSGNVTGQVLDASSPSGEAPVADRDGNFYFTTSWVYSVKPDGTIRWRELLGPNAGLPQEGTSTSRMLLSPEGILYFAASDGFVYAMRASDGSIVWKQPGGLDSQGLLQGIGAGSGDTFYVGGVPHLATTGEASAQSVVNGKTVWSLGSYSGITAWYYETMGGYTRTRSFMLDRCGKLLWSFSNQQDYSWMVEFFGFDEHMLVWSDYPSRSGYIYDVAGHRLLGPMPLEGSPGLLGADSTIYSFNCSDNHPEAGNQTLIAYSWGLEKLWSLDLGKGCSPDGSGVLDDNGVLYFARQLSTGIQVVAVQTQSPGLAQTAMPVWLYNNRRTGWLE